MSLLQSMQPTIKEISQRHQSLSIFIQKAQKQLPVLRQKLMSAIPKDVTKIQEAVNLISEHINRNHSEAQDLNDVSEALLTQGQSDINGASAVQSLKQLCKQGKAVIDGLENLQTLISGIEVLVESKKQEQMTSSITNQPQRPPQPTPKKYNQTPINENQKITELQKQLEKANEQLQIETDNNIKQQLMIEDIQIEVQTAQNKHRQEVNQLKNQNSILLKDIASLKSNVNDSKMIQELQDQILLQQEEINMLRQENDDLTNQSEQEIKELEQQLIDVQNLAKKEFLKQNEKQHIAKNVQILSKEEKLNIKHQTCELAINKLQNVDDELSDPNDAQMTVQKSQYAQPIDQKQQEIYLLKKDKEDMQNLIDSLKLVLIKMSVNIDSPKIQQYLTKNQGVVLVPSTIDDLEMSDREILRGSLRGSAMNTSLW